MGKSAQETLKEEKMADLNLKKIVATAWKTAIGDMEIGEKVEYEGGCILSAEKTDDGELTLVPLGITSASGKLSVVVNDAGEVGLETQLDDFVKPVFKVWGNHLLEALAAKGGFTVS